MESSGAVAGLLVGEDTCAICAGTGFGSGKCMIEQEGRYTPIVSRIARLQQAVQHIHKIDN